MDPAAAIREDDDDKASPDDTPSVAQDQEKKNTPDTLDNKPPQNLAASFAKPPQGKASKTRNNGVPPGAKSKVKPN